MLYLKKSKLPGAGKGLFTKEDIKRGEIVCEYEGELVPWSVCEERSKEGHEGYVFFITKNRCVDAYFTPWALGRYANDASGVGRVENIRNNAQYEIKTRSGEKRVFIVATRKINANDEVLVSYGNDYWKNLDKTKHLYDKLQIKLKAERIARKAAKEKLNKKKK